MVSNEFIDFNSTDKKELLKKNIQITFQKQKVKECLKLGFLFKESNSPSVNYSVQLNNPVSYRCDSNLMNKNRFGKNQQQ